MDEQKGGHVLNSLFEDSWFFGNTLLTNKSRLYSSKMVRSYSDPCTSSSSKEEILVSRDPYKTSNLLRTPSLPPCIGRETKFEGGEREEEKEEENETRMGDLIRQAMPMPMLLTGRKLDRAPSMSPCRGKEVVHMVSNIHSGSTAVGRLTRRASIDSPVLLPEKGPVGMAKLSRRASIDFSMVLPSKYTSKTKQSTTSNFKNRPQRKQDPTETRSPNLDKSMSQKSPNDLEIEELQGFKDLSFSFDNKQVSPSVPQILPALPRKGSINSNFDSHHQCLNKVVRRPYLSEAWERTSPSASAPPVLKRVDQKPPSAEDMKAHIKFWARAVAFNVRQEC